MEFEVVKGDKIENYQGHKRGVDRESYRSKATELSYKLHVHLQQVSLAELRQLGRGQIRGEALQLAGSSCTCCLVNCSGDLSAASASHYLGL